jgi:hypothetical protein
MAKIPSESTGETPGMVPTGKGHATPKRKEREAAQRRPLVPTSKEDTKKRREDQRLRTARENQALKTGDERYMPRQHLGAPRRFARDFIDARTTVTEFMLPAAMVSMVALLFFGNSVTIMSAVTLALLLLMVTWAVESVILLRRMRKQASARFGAGKLPRMYAMYGLTRLMQIRRMRLPKPQVKRGEYPA